MPRANGREAAHLRFAVRGRNVPAMKHLATALALLAAPAAFAQAPAALWPTRDVTIVFDAPAQMGGQTMQMAFAAKSRLARMDMGPQGFGIVDYNAKQMTMVMPAQQIYMVMTVPDNAPFSTDMADHNFTRVGTRRVAGLSCTDWRAQPKANPNQQAVVCLTDDGVVLRTEVASANFVTEAKEVRYGALDPALFRVPDGFTRMDMPGAAPRRR